MTSSCKEKSTCKSTLQANDLILIHVSGYRGDRIILPRGGYFLQAKIEQVFKNKLWLCHSHPTQKPGCRLPASTRQARCHCWHFQLRTLSCELLCASLKDADEVTQRWRGRLNRPPTVNHTQWSLFWKSHRVIYDS